MKLRKATWESSRSLSSTTSIYEAVLAFLVTFFSKRLMERILFKPKFDFFLKDETNIFSKLYCLNGLHSYLEVSNHYWMEQENLCTEKEL